MTESDGEAARSAQEELRELVRRRAVLWIEGAACLGAAAAMWSLSARVQGATPEAQSVFLVVAFAFGVACARMVAGMIPVLTFRCPRCDGLFHADASRRTVRLRACAHCGLSPERFPGEADAETR